MQDRDLTCRKCGETLGELTVLIGGFRTKLCNRCGNEWTKYIIKTSEFLEYAQKQVALQAAIASGNEVRAMELKLDCLRLERQLFALAEEWLEESNE